MNTEQMRAEIIKVYPDSITWPKRVYAMSDSQVVAIFRRFQSDGKI